MNTKQRYERWSRKLANVRYRYRCRRCGKFYGTNIRLAEPPLCSHEPGSGHKSEPMTPEGTTP